MAALMDAFGMLCFRALLMAASNLKLATGLVEAPSAQHNIIIINILIKFTWLEHYYLVHMKITCINAIFHSFYLKI